MSAATLLRLNLVKTVLTYTTHGDLLRQVAGVDLVVQPGDLGGMAIQ